MATCGARALCAAAILLSGFTVARGSAAEPLTQPAVAGKAGSVSVSSGLADLLASACTAPSAEGGANDGLCRDLYGRLTELYAARGGGANPSPAAHGVERRESHAGAEGADGGNAAELGPSDTAGESLGQLSARPRPHPRRTPLLRA